MAFFDKFKKALGIIPEPESQINKEESKGSSPNNIEEKIESNVLPPAPLKRKEICRFIIQSLNPYIDEPEIFGSGLKLFLVYNTPEELELLKVALYANTPNKFKDAELQKDLADNYIKLTNNWKFEYEFCLGELPNCRFSDRKFGLEILENIKTEPLKVESFVAKIEVLDGQTSQKKYILNFKEKQEFRIGRGYNPRLATGRTRQNDIVFLPQDDANFDSTKEQSGLSVSRNHATIKFDAEQQKYFLFVDEGGLPQNNNRTKILRENNTSVKLQVLGMPYELTIGDEIELGDGALLSFQKTNLSEKEPVKPISENESEINEEIPKVQIMSDKRFLPYDYIIVDTNIWIDIDKRCLPSLMTLLKVCKAEGVKMKLLEKVYEEIQKKLKELPNKDSQKQISRAKNIILDYSKEKVIEIDEIQFVNDKNYSTYADPQIAQTFINLLQEGKKVMLITNDNDLTIRVISHLKDYPENQYKLFKKEDLINFTLKLKEWF